MKPAQVAADRGSIPVWCGFKDCVIIILMMTLMDHLINTRVTDYLINL